jgi:hypothetical protein
LALAYTLLAVSGCGEDPGDVVSGPGAQPVADSGAPVVAASCAASASSETCDCNNGGVVSQGTRSCYQGTWTTCSCQAAPPVVNSGDCKAGHYEGDFEGWYRSGFILGLAIPVYALDISFGPALKFTLEEQVGGDAEFPVYKIADGEINGTADFVFPFKAALTGTLDCRTKTLTGEMDGGYSIVLPVGINEGKFIGPVTGQYNATDHSFSGGTWTLHEEDALGISVLGMTGGEGTWKAKWVSPP